MAEGVDRRRIAEVVGRNVNRLHRGDGARGGVADALFQVRKFGGQRRLVAEPRRQLAHQPGNFRAGLDEAENVVDQQQHVLARVVAKILGHGQGRVADAKARARRFVHLAEHQHGLVEHARGLDLAVQFLAFAAALADAAEHADTLVVADDVVDQLRDQHGLADAGAAEQPALAAALQRSQHVDGFDAGLEDFRSGGAPHERHRSA